MTTTRILIAPAIERGEGIYSVLIGNGTFVSNTGPIDYTMTFETTVVPVPAAVWLFVSGLIGIARRRKAA